MSGDRPPWFKIALQVRGSVIPSILPRVLLCGGFGVLISLLHFFKWPVSLPILSSIVPSIVLGLLLVFRTNTAYERFWEGRKMWGTLVNNVRNLARQIWVAIEEKDPPDIELKKSVLRLLPAFAVALKLHLRQQSVNPELEPLMSPVHYQKLKSMNNPPLEIAVGI
ncbi:bestrophin family ion channel, partial [Microcoleus sp. HI-ES]|nr:bestrophin family ion channel [Microcoleus sp. HI-ES]MCZ0903545.1 bestrophin family ion channel [Microcoleus sp. HI-ES]